MVHRFQAHQIPSDFPIALVSQVDILQSVFSVVAGVLQSGTAIAEQELSFHTTGTFCPASHGSKYKTGVCIYHAVVFHSGIPFKNTFLFLGSPNQC